MADSIKIGNNDITLKLGSSDVTAAYIGSTLVYSGGTPPTPSFKWLATYTGGTTSSAECDSTSAITDGEISYSYNVVSVEIGDCVTSIGIQVFYNCRSLTSIEIPSGVTSIGFEAFYGCSSLTSITVNATTPPILGNDAFEDTNNCPIYLPYESIGAYMESSWGRYADRIQPIPNS